MSQGFARGSSSGSGTVTSVATAGLATGGPITATGTVTVTAAVASDQETGTSTTVAVVPAIQQRHPSAAKAWAYFASYPAASADASYNVASVTNNGTGDETITFTTSFSSTNYAAVATGQAQAVAGINATGGHATGSIRMLLFFSGAASNGSQVSLVCFGDQ